MLSGPDALEHSRFLLLSFCAQLQRQTRVADVLAQTDPTRLYTQLLLSPVLYPAGAPARRGSYADLAYASNTAEESHGDLNIRQ